MKMKGLRAESFAIRLVTITVCATAAVSGGGIMLAVLAGLALNRRVDVGDLKEIFQAAFPTMLALLAKVQTSGLTEEQEAPAKVEVVNEPSDPVQVEESSALSAAASRRRAPGRG